MTKKRSYILGIVFFMLVSITVAQEEIVVTPSHIVDNIRFGDFSERYLTVINNGDESIDFDASTEGRIIEFLETAADSFTVEGGQSIIVKFTLLGRDLGIYNGTIELTGDISKSIPVNLTISEVIGIPIEALKMDIEPYVERVGLGDNYKFQVILHNLLSEKKYNVTLVYSIDAI